MKRRLGTLIFITTLLAAGPAAAMGLLLPNQEGAGPLAIESHRVQIDITDSAAVTRVDQVFRNSSGNQLEATFIFPLPADATVSDFALWINGVRTQGEVLESTQARQIYNNIVRRVEDPGLVEYIDGRIFQASIFPVPANGTQRVQLEFAQVLERQGDLLRLTYPLRTGRTSAQTLTDFTIAANIQSSDPLRTIYSPTHEVDVVRRSDSEAVVGLEQVNADLEQDFVLYLSTSSEDIGMDLMTFDPDGPGGEDGYFLMVVAPRLETEGEIPAKDVTFVIDTSGSMAGEKLEQAQATLRYCVGRLRPQDRFNVIRFSTASRSLFEGLTQASPDNVARAHTFLNDLRAAGGTAIEEALVRATSQESSPQRPHMVIFITDGLPTVGETDANTLASNVITGNEGAARVFTFGVGFDVDTTLLDRVASDNRGVSDYVRPGENMEMPVSNLYDRIAFPVLTDINMNISGVEIDDTYPRAVPDLFAGQQVVVTGRYEGPGTSQVTLAGHFSGQSVNFAFHEDFVSGVQSTEDAHDFIPQLWATRKIGYLIEQIRLNGENRELVDEVRNLGVRYGLVTPYTSYLAVDDSEFQPTPRMPTPDFDRRFAPEAEEMSGWGAQGNRTRRSGDGFLSRDEGEVAADPAPTAAGIDSNTGPEAVVAAQETRRLREQSVADGRVAVRRIGSYTLNFDTDGVWRSANVDRNEASNRVVIRYMSEAYFRLLELQPDVARLVALGDRVEFEFRDSVVQIDASSGMERMDADTEALFY